MASNPRETIDLCNRTVTRSQDREERSGTRYSNYNNEMRLMDLAAAAFAALRTGPGEPYSPLGFLVGQGGPKLFDPFEPDESRRDAQSEALKKWYRDNEVRLTWDDAHHKFALAPVSAGK